MFSENFNREIDRLLNDLNIQTNTNLVYPLNNEYITIEDVNNYNGNVSGVMMGSWSNITFYNINKKGN